MELTSEEIMEVVGYQKAIHDTQVFGVKDFDGTFNLFVNASSQEIKEHVRINRSTVFPEML